MQLDGRAGNASTRGGYLASRLHPTSTLGRDASLSRKGSQISYQGEMTVRIR